MGYVLESATEFKRLEHQSTFAKYDYVKELSEFAPSSGQRILDAGCGSGIVSRYLADRFSEAQVVGCDFSPERVSLAQQAALAQSNLKFQTENLTRLSFAKHSFHHAICRYVVEHLPPKERGMAMKEVFRSLRPGGTFHVIDFDGIYENMYPQNSLITETLQKVRASGEVDLEVGRKIPSLLAEAGFVGIRWRIETIECRGQMLEDEKVLLPDRLQGALPYLKSLWGSEVKAQEFIHEFLRSLDQPNMVLFYNKFIVVGKKPETLRTVTS